jgi:hypothetical protein
MLPVEVTNGQDSRDQGGSAATISVPDAPAPSPKRRRCVVQLEFLDPHARPEPRAPLSATFWMDVPHPCPRCLP